MRRVYQDIHGYSYRSLASLDDAVAYDGLAVIWVEGWWSSLEQYNSSYY
jgi:hypothetical protein